jgi:hypothetical protein
MKKLKDAINKQIVLLTLIASILTLIEKYVEESK